MGEPRLFSLSQYTRQNATKESARRMKEELIPGMGIFWPIRGHDEMNVKMGRK
jgi:hypothetical protein